MTRAQQQLVILVGLVGVMIVVYARARGPRAPSAPPQPAVEEYHHTDASEGTASSSSGIDVFGEVSDLREAQREHAASVGWRRDPFIRGGSAAGTRGLALSGILWDPTKPMAILNDQMVSVGDEVEGYQVLEIGTDRVLITDGTETIQLLIGS